ncbi:MAG: hypothetical protein QOK37_4106 [Thermoanaerobaculia bacterium]|jgi:hypothetical protein|nr:hypothetical protein [Thermoanaerobaculia bacterium]
MRKITVKVSGVTDQSRKREQSSRGAAAAVIGLAIALIALSTAHKPSPKGEEVTEKPPSPPTSAVLAVDRTRLRFTGTDPELVHLRNTGGELLTVKQPSLTSAAFRITSDCTSPLRANESCVVSVVMDPNAAPESNEKLLLASNGGSASVELIGNVSSLAPLEMAHLVFGRHLLGTASDPQPVHFANSTRIPFALAAADTAVPFRIVKDTCGGTSVAPGGGCDVFLSFEPAILGSQNGEVRIATIGGKLAAFAPLSGEAVAPLPQLKLQRVDFGKQPLGSTTKQRALLINSTPFPLSLSYAATDPPFRVARDGCQKVPVKPSGRCEVWLAFSPSSQGEQKGEIRISNAEGVVIARGSLSGAGYPVLPPPPPPPRPQLTMPAIDFDQRPIGGFAPVKSTTLINTTPVSLSIGGAQTDPPFSIVRDCAKSELTPGSPCDVSISFNPSTPGKASGEVRVTSSDGYVIARGALSGIGIAQMDQQAPQIFIKPRAINFKGTPGSQRIVISNRGVAPVTLQVKTDTSRRGYSFDTSDCTRAPLAPNSDCWITVTATFMAVRSGESARINITYAGHTDVVVGSAK